MSKGGKVIKYSSVLKQYLKLFNEFCREPFNKSKSHFTRIMGFTYALGRQFFDAFESSCDGDVGTAPSVMADAVSQLIDADIRGLGTHIFIKDRALYEALKKIKVKDVEGVKQFMRDNAETFRFMHSVEDKDSHESIREDFYEQKCMFYFIHFPVETEDEEGLAVRLRLDGEELVCDYVCGEHIATFSSESKYIKNPSNDFDKMDQKLWYLFLNVFFYMKAYPECVVDGVPKGFRFEYPSVAKKVRLELSDKIVEKVSNGVSHVVTPHFRRGHFRYLRSEYFKNKQGEFIFIEETLVKANNAKTLNTLESDNID